MSKSSVTYNDEEVGCLGAVTIVILALIITYLILPWWIQLAVGVMGYSITFKTAVGFVMLLQGIKIGLGIKSNS